MENAKKEKDNKVKKEQKYRHFKGNEYIVEDIALHTETGEQLVIYRDLNDKEKLYARPYNMFVSKVDKEKYPEVKQEFRFEIQENKRKE